MLLVERHHIDPNPEIIRLCIKSKELYNKCTYLMRQAWFTHNHSHNISFLVKQVEDEACYQELHNTKTAKQTVWQVIHDWSNFRKALKAYKLDPSKFKKEPQPPYYKENLAQVIFYYETIKKKPLKQGMITPTNDLFTIKSTRKFKQVILTPKTFGFIVDIQYEKQETKPLLHEDRVSCVDIGVNNLSAITSNQHSPLLVNGRILKSINRAYNKKINKRTSRKRYFSIENYFHHTSKFLVNLCIKHGISTIIIGKNDGWKEFVRMRKAQRQNFQFIPFIRLFEKIIYKAGLVGIKVTFTEEAYTSKSSFLDRDPIPPYEKGVKPPEFSGRRVKGMYYSSSKPIHADVHGSLNIGRKIIGDKVYAFPDRSIAAMPVRINPLRVFAYNSRDLG